mmetsp:Transcript_22378/g.48853  ORF Transcript_22378/g.48853 Transcript_22378/m.48853 type:complete len:263 (+) Transcript_22378:270-1058(+)
MLDVTKRMDMSLDDIIKSSVKKKPVPIKQAPGKTSNLAAVDGKKQTLQAMNKRGKAQRAAKQAQARGMDVDMPAAPLVIPRTQAPNRPKNNSKLSTAITARVAAAVARGRGQGSRGALARGRGRGSPSQPATLVSIPKSIAESIKITIPGGAKLPAAVRGQRGLGGQGKGNQINGGRTGRGRGQMSSLGGLMRASAGIVKPGQAAARTSSIGVGAPVNRSVTVLNTGRGFNAGRGRGRGAARGRGLARAPAAKTLSQRFSGK